MSGRRFPLVMPSGPLTRAERREIDGLFEREDVRKLMTMLRSPSDGAAVEVMDATYWMKGCSSSDGFVLQRC